MTDRSEGFWSRWEHQRNAAREDIRAELQSHIELLADQLEAEGYTRPDALAEAKRRFGDLEELTEQCAAAKAAPFDATLQLARDLTGAGWPLVAITACAFLALADPGTFVHRLPPFFANAVTLLAVTFLAAGPSTKSRSFRRTGTLCLSLAAVLGFESFFLSRGDLQHSYWSVVCGVHGFLLGSGFLIAAVPPDDRGPGRRLARTRRGTWIGLSVFGVFGALALLLPQLPFDHSPAGRPIEAPLRAFIEVLHYGFGGPVPSTMAPEVSSQLEQGLGSPPRMITAMMGATLFPSLYATAFALIASTTHWLPGWSARRRVQLLLPLLSALLVHLFVYRPVDLALWRNEPWLVRMIGPCLAIAVAVSVLLLLALEIAHLKGRSKPVSDTHRKDGYGAVCEKAPYR